MEVAHTVTRKRLRLKASNEGDSRVGDGGGNDRQEEMEEGGVRKKQVFQGVMKKFILIKLDILIIAEFWPSVVVGLETNTSNQLWIYSRDMPTYMQRLFPSHIRWISDSEVASLARANEVDIVVIQGAGSFTEEVLTSFGQDISPSKLFVILPAERLRPFNRLKKKIMKWYKIRHDEIGGVSNSKWLIGIGRQERSVSFPPLSEICATVGMHRHFSDVLKTATRGKVCDPPSKRMPTLISLESVSDNSEFYVPCVMSRTGWVSRLLIPQEQGAIYDFPELYMAKLASEEAELSHSDFKFLFNASTVPMKIVSILKGLVTKITGSSNIIIETSNTMKSREALPQENNFTSGLLQDPIVGDIAVDQAKDVATKYLAQFGDKAARSDNASVPVELWNSVLFEKHFSHIAYSPVKHGRALEIIRNKFALRIYVVNVVSSFFKFIKKEHGDDWLTFYLATRKQVKGKAVKRKRGWIKRSERYQKLRIDLSIGMEGLTRVVKGSWWEWDYGSTLFFWRWPKEIRDSARDGYPVFVQGDLPRYRRKQRPPDKEYMHIKMTEKLKKVTDRKYISKGVVRSLINCFAVEKGSDDIRLVYDGTKSKLNAAVFAPNFYLPFLDSVLMWVNVDSWLADLDLGEMFLNYFLDKRIRAFSGVDLTKFLDEESEKSNWERWNRTFMGFCPSPYLCCKFFGWTVDIIYGDRWDQNNPYRWDCVRTNFPGSPSYDPTQPRLCKMIGEIIAAILEVFVDDIRTVGGSMMRCRDATRRASQLLQYLGQQDAARKYRPPHTTPGPWCGSFIAIRNRSVWVYVSGEKWNKAKKFVLELASIIDKGPQEKIPFKFLERGRGFMVYFCRTYVSFVPYLKGIHLTLDSWRVNRDEEGWKEKRRVIPEDEGIREIELEEGMAKDFADPLSLDEAQAEISAQKLHTDHPDEVVAVPRLKHDVSALSVLLSREVAPWRFIRGDKVASVQYGFGDAAKSGFGATFEDQNGNIWFRLGVWGDDTSDRSSNWRELANLVEALEAKAQDENFRGIEIFLFTDNSTAEAAFYKGASSSKRLFDLILRLKKLELAVGCLFHVIHVSGNRMIRQGTDGTSRGDLGEGVMIGDTMLSFIPLHLSALDRCSQLKEEIRRAIIPAKGEKEIVFLECEDWFSRAHDIIGGEKNEDGIWIPTYQAGTYIWTPPPAGAHIAVEQLRKARLKRENSTHVFLVPRLMSMEWKRQLFRVSDLFLELPFDQVWTKEKQLEPLTFAVVFPFLNHRPWQLKRTQAFLGMANVLRRMWKEGQGSTWDLLRKFLEQSRKLEGLSEGVVRQMLQSPAKFGFSYSQGTE